MKGVINTFIIEDKLITPQETGVPALSTSLLLYAYI